MLSRETVRATWRRAMLVDRRAKRPARVGWSRAGASKGVASRVGSCTGLFARCDQVNGIARHSAWQRARRRGLAGVAGSASGSRSGSEPGGFSVNWPSSLVAAVLGVSMVDSTSRIALEAIVEDRIFSNQCQIAI